MLKENRTDRITEMICLFFRFIAHVFYLLQWSLYVSTLRDIDRTKDLGISFNDQLVTKERRLQNISWNFVDD